MPDSSDRHAPPSDRDGGSARVVFLGGVGEVGRNMACVELDGRILIVDVGLSFILSSAALSSRALPTQSSRTCTLTPFLARSASASANSSPIVPSQ